MLYTKHMDLGTAQQILVVILSTVLAIGLIIAVVLGIMVINLVRAIHRMVEKAEHAVESAEAVGQFIKNAAGPVGALRVLRMVAKMVTKHK
jgi:hypothetical protein